MKLAPKDFRKYALIYAAAGLANSVFGSIFNTYVPIFLQSGNREFDLGRAATSTGFGLSPFWSSFLLAGMNLVAFIALPVIGLWSDKIGRKQPFFVYVIPIALIGVMGLPLTKLLIPAIDNGFTNQLVIPLITLVLLGSLAVAGSALAGAPSAAMIYQFVPSVERSKLDGFRGFVSITLFLMIMFMIGPLYRISYILPFIVAGGTLFVFWIGIVFFIQEPGGLPASSSLTSKSQAHSEIPGLETKRNRKAEWKDVAIMALVSFGLWSTIIIMQAFSSSYFVKVMRMSESVSIQLLMVFHVGLLALVIPAGYLSARIGRRITLRIGSFLLSILTIFVYFFPSFPVILVCATAMGGAWALLITNLPPTFSNLMRAQKNTGTVFSIYSISVQLASLLTVPVVGWLVEQFGNDFNILWLCASCVSFLGFVLLFLVKGGEVQPDNT